MAASLSSRLRRLVAAAAVAAALGSGAGPVVADSASMPVPSMDDMMGMMHMMDSDMQAHADLMLGLSAASSAMEAMMSSDDGQPMSALTVSIMEIMARSLAQMESMMSMLHDMQAMMPPAGDAASPEMTTNMAMHSDEVMIMFMDTVAQLRLVVEMWLSLMAEHSPDGS